jgi:hypothetical protein
VRATDRRSFNPLSIGSIVIPLFARSPAPYSFPEVGEFHEIEPSIVPNQKPAHLELWKWRRDQIGETPDFVRPDFSEPTTDAPWVIELGDIGQPVPNRMRSIGGGEPAIIRYDEQARIMTTQTSPRVNCPAYYRKLDVDPPALL